MPGIVAAQVCLTVLDHQPPAPLARARITEMEVNRHAAVTRKLIDMSEASNVPHQETGIELVAPESAADPACPPMADCQDDGTQFLPGRREPVFPAVLAAHA